jgi:hypothetical protein
MTKNQILMGLGFRHDGENYTYSHRLNIDPENVIKLPEWEAEREVGPDWEFSHWLNDISNHIYRLGETFEKNRIKKLLR